MSVVVDCQYAKIVESIRQGEPTLYSVKCACPLPPWIARQNSEYLSPQTCDHCLARKPHAAAEEKALHFIAALGCLHCPVTIPCRDRSMCVRTIKNHFTYGNNDPIKNAQDTKLYFLRGEHDLSDRLRQDLNKAETRAEQAEAEREILAEALAWGAGKEKRSVFDKLPWCDSKKKWLDHAADEARKRKGGFRHAR